MANTYLLQSSLAAAEAITAAQATAVGCDGTLTKYWWRMIPNSSTAAVAIEIVPGDPFYDSTTKQFLGGQSIGLTVGQTALLVTAAQAQALGYPV